MKTNKKYLKMYKKFIPLILCGDKTSETRKLSKGLTEDDYYLLNIELMKHHKVDYINGKFVDLTEPNTNRLSQESAHNLFVMALVHLTPDIMWNKTKEDLRTWRRACKDLDFDGLGNTLDQESINFINANYYGKHEFVIYSISNVRSVE